MSAIAEAEYVDAARTKASEMEGRLIKRARDAHTSVVDKQKAEEQLKRLVEKLAQNMSGHYPSR